MKIAVLATTSPSGEEGGAERFYEGLRDALVDAGMAAEIVPVVSDERDFVHVQQSYLRFYDLDLSSFDGVISTKAPGYLIRHPNHLCYLQHTMRVFYDMFDAEFPSPSNKDHENRDLIRRLDTLALQPPRTKRIFTISHTVSDRLRDYNGLESEVLYQASSMRGFYPGEYRYVFLPGRLHRWKRVHLVIKAMEFVAAPVELIVSGTGEDEAALRVLAANDPRIRFVGRVSDEQLLELYANALAVAFVPLREDFGLVTLEAFHSKKPVITCVDSGEAARLVSHEQTGFVCAPDPKDLARRIDQLAADPSAARRMGVQGAASIASISWGYVADRLIAALDEGATGEQSSPAGDRTPAAAKPLDITVLDMQPIDPPTGGGRLRLLGLYHGLGYPTTYVGTYDWPGEKDRDHALSPTLREIDIPLSDEHHAAAKELAAALGGKVVIDSSFHRFAGLSERYHQVALGHITNADVVIFSHPWVYPQFRESLDLKRQLLVYDSHNVEGLLRLKLLDDGNGPGAQLVREVVEIEAELCRTAHLILACSHNDRELFHRFYDVPYARIAVAPNGVFTSELTPTDEGTRAQAKVDLGLPDCFTALFLGSNYAPNVEAADFIVEQLAPSLNHVTFVIAGGVGEGISHKRKAPKNVRVTGTITEEDKRRCLKAADIAVNPMFSGSGTNIKMLEFMSAGLPVVTTATGARGLRRLVPSPFVEVPPNGMAAAIDDLRSDPATRRELAHAARREATEVYSWNRITMDLGLLLSAAQATRTHSPFFSVVIPTYDRASKLAALMSRLEQQTERDFEVLVIDQSPEPWAEARRSWRFRFHYYHTDVRGAVGARNKGAFFARGEIIAFIDDDCLPAKDWLEKARTYFVKSDIVGLEGLIVSDTHDVVNYRPVSNRNFHGLGFMTANLFIRREIFHALDGFDVAFDRPHFREDTDFGWRALDLGLVPFAKDVMVFHPAHPRSIQRESLESRVEYFEKDALLYRKHPERYKQLFLAEEHWMNTPGFWDHFLRGHEKYAVTLDPYFLGFKPR